MSWGRSRTQPGPWSRWDDRRAGAGNAQGEAHMSSFELELETTASARLKVIGVGGAGGNAVNRMIGAGLRGVDFITANTDVQALNQSLAPTRIQIGPATTRGLGSGGDPSTGRRAAQEHEQAIADVLTRSDMVFITA